MPQGKTDLEQRFIPMSGFTSGTWTFQLILESVDTDDNAATLVISQDLDGSIIVP